MVESAAPANASARDANATPVPEASARPSPASERDPVPAAQPSAPTQVSGTTQIASGEVEAIIQGPLTVGAPFGTRYMILKLLGIGGMGAVYQAWDQELGVPVALKVVRTEMAGSGSGDEMGARFKRELLLAREVTHKNVVRIHDLGDIDGIKYFTMTYIEGEDLASLLSRVGKLPVTRALEIFRQVLEGMIAAHEKGIVHRDLKPANVMIDRHGDALLMDFGIARSAQISGQRPTSPGVIPSTPFPDELHDALTVNVSPAPDASSLGSRAPFPRPTQSLSSTSSPQPTSSSQPTPPTSPTSTLGGSVVDLGETRVGAVIGTPEYMAPEQYLGEVADQRADVYALGLILYDLLLGRKRTFVGRRALQEVKKRVRRPPPSARSIDPTIPEAVDRLIEKCLQPEPEERFQSTLELAEELARLDARGEPLPRYSRRAKVLMTLGAAAVVGALVATYFLARTEVPVGTQEPLSVLVADLENDTEESSFDGAFEEALVIAMEGGGFISAYPRGSALQIAERLQSGSRLDPTMSRLIARREGIEAILIPSIEVSGRGYRVEVTAVDPALEAGDGDSLARARARSSDRDGVLGTVGKLASELRSELGDTTPEAARLAAAETVTAASLVAMKHYALGQDLFYQGRFEDAIAEFEEAVGEDSGLGRAYAGMGAAYANLQQQEQAEASYQQALQHLDRMTERERFRTLGGYYLIVSRNYPKAVENYQTLVELYPADRAGHANLALASLYSRDFQKAMEEGNRAVELDPNNAVQRVNSAVYAVYAGDFQRGADEARELLAENADFAYARLTLARAAAAAGDVDEAKREYRAIAGPGGLGRLAWVGLVDLELLAGRPDEALRLLDEANAAGATGLALDLVRAEALLMGGDLRQAAEVASRVIAAGTLESVLYPAGRVLISAGRAEPVGGLIETLDGMLQTQTLAYARLLEGELALAEGRLGDGLEVLRAVQGRYDTWLAHLILGRTYLEAKQYAEAVDELTTCAERKGEVTDVFLADLATLRYYPEALDLLGRAQLGILDRESARRSFDAYLALRPDGSDPRTAAVRALMAEL